MSADPGPGCAFRIAQAPHQQWTQSNNHRSERGHSNLDTALSSRWPLGRSFCMEQSLLRL
jgi:hypothetical protein